MLSGAKRAAAGLLEADYRAEGEEPESVGERLVLIRSDGERVTEVDVGSVEIVPFRDVSWEFARAEGEGCENLGHWRRVHAEYWKSAGRTVTDDTDVVCVRFTLAPAAR